MTKIDHIKAAIAALPADEVARLREWLMELDEQRFDEQIERDAAAGKLDELIAKARDNYKAGRLSEL